MKRLLFAGLLWLIPSMGWAAIAFDSATTMSSNNSTTVTGSHTPVSTTNGVALACVTWQRGTLGTLNSVTYGGNAMTLIAGATDGGGQRRAELWRYVGYASGASTVTGTFDATKNDARMTVMTYTGVDQVTPIGTAATATGGASPITVNVTSAAGELVVDCAEGGASADPITVGAGQTQRSNHGDGTNHTQVTSEEAGAASVTMSWTLTASDYWAQVAVPLKPASAAAACPSRSLLGVGC